MKNIFFKMVRVLAVIADSGTGKAASAMFV